METSNNQKLSLLLIAAAAADNVHAVPVPYTWPSSSIASATSYRLLGLDARPLQLNPSFWNAVQNVSLVVERSTIHTIRFGDNFTIGDGSSVTFRDCVVTQHEEPDMSNVSAPMALSGADAAFHFINCTFKALPRSDPDWTVSRRGRALFLGIVAASSSSQILIASCRYDYVETLDAFDVAVAPSDAVVILLAHSHHREQPNPNTWAEGLSPSRGAVFLVGSIVVVDSAFATNAGMQGMFRIRTSTILVLNRETLEIFSRLLLLFGGVLNVSGNTVRISAHSAAIAAGIATGSTASDNDRAKAILRPWALSLDPNCATTAKSILFDGNDMAATDIFAAALPSFAGTTSFISISGRFFSDHMVVPPIVGTGLVSACRNRVQYLTLAIVVATSPITLPTTIALSVGVAFDRVGAVRIDNNWIRCDSGYAVFGIVTGLRGNGTGDDRMLLSVSNNSIFHFNTYATSGIQITTATFRRMGDVVLNFNEIVVKNVSSLNRHAGEHRRLGADILTPTRRCIFVDHYAAIDCELEFTSVAESNCMVAGWRSLVVHNNTLLISDSPKADGIVLDGGVDGVGFVNITNNYIVVRQLPYFEPVNLSGSPMEATVGAIRALGFWPNGDLMIFHKNIVDVSCHWALSCSGLSFANLAHSAPRTNTTMRRVHFLDNVVLVSKSQSTAGEQIMSGIDAFVLGTLRKFSATLFAGNKIQVVMSGKQCPAGGCSAIRVEAYDDVPEFGAVTIVDNEIFLRATGSTITAICPLQSSGFPDTSETSKTLLVLFPPATIFYCSTVTISRNKIIIRSYGTGQFAPIIATAISFSTSGAGGAIGAVLIESNVIDIRLRQRGALIYPAQGGEPGWGAILVGSPVTQNQVDGTPFFLVTRARFGMDLRVGSFIVRDTVAVLVNAGVFFGNSAGLNIDREMLIDHCSVTAVPADDDEQNRAAILYRSSSSGGGGAFPPFPFDKERLDVSVTAADSLASALSARQAMFRILSSTALTTAFIRRFEVRGGSDFVSRAVCQTKQRSLAGVEMHNEFLLVTGTATVAEVIISDSVITFECLRDTATSGHWLLPIAFSISSPAGMQTRSEEGFWPPILPTRINIHSGAHFLIRTPSSSSSSSDGNERGHEQVLQKIVLVGMYRSDQLPEVPDRYKHGNSISLNSSNIFAAEHPPVESSPSFDPSSYSSVSLGRPLLPLSNRENVLFWADPPFVMRGPVSQSSASSIMAAGVECSQFGGGYITMKTPALRASLSTLPDTSVVLVSPICTIFLARTISKSRLRLSRTSNLTESRSEEQTNTVRPETQRPRKQDVVVTPSAGASAALMALSIANPGAYSHTFKLIGIQATRICGGTGPNNSLPAITLVPLTWESNMLTLEIGVHPVLRTYVGGAIGNAILFALISAVLVAYIYIFYVKYKKRSFEDGCESMRFPGSALLCGLIVGLPAMMAVAAVASYKEILVNKRSDFDILIVSPVSIVFAILPAYCIYTISSGCRSLEMVDAKVASKIAREREEERREMKRLKRRSRRAAARRGGIPSSSPAPNLASLIAAMEDSGHDNDDEGGAGDVTRAERAARRRRRSAAETDAEDESPQRAGIVGWIVQSWIYWFDAWAEWKPSAHVDRWGLIFDTYSISWFWGFEYLLAMACGMFSGITLTCIKDSCCAFGAIIQVIMALIHTVVTLRMHPTLSRFDRVNSALMTVAILLLAVLTLMEFYGLPVTAVLESVASIAIMLAFFSLFATFTPVLSPLMRFAKRLMRSRRAAARADDDTASVESPASTRAMSLRIGDHFPWDDEEVDEEYFEYDGRRRRRRMTAVQVSEMLLSPLVVERQRRHGQGWDQQQQEPEEGGQQRRWRWDGGDSGGRSSQFFTSTILDRAEAARSRQEAALLRERAAASRQQLLARDLHAATGTPSNPISVINGNLHRSSSHRDERPSAYPSSSSGHHHHDQQQEQRQRRGSGSNRDRDGHDDSVRRSPSSGSRRAHHSGRASQGILAHSSSTPALVRRFDDDRRRAGLPPLAVASPRTAATFHSSPPAPAAAAAAARVPSAERRQRGSNEQSEQQRRAVAETRQILAKNAARYDML